MIRNSENTMPSGASSHNAGVRKRRSSSGWRMRRISTEAQITMNADKVPMFTSSASSRIGSSPAASAVNTPSIRVGRCGVPYFGCDLANHAGNRPSRDNANQMRAAPSMKANTTLAMPHTAAMLMMPLIQCRSRAANTALTGAELARIISEHWPGTCEGSTQPLYGTMPVSTSEMARYIAIATPSEAITASGRSRCGFFDSSAAVVRVS